MKWEKYNALKPLEFWKGETEKAYFNTKYSKLNGEK